MKIEITDEVAEKSLSIMANYAGGCPSLDPHSDLCDDTQCACRTIMRLALESVSPLIANEVLERAAQEYARHPVVASAIRALKEPTQVQATPPEVAKIENIFAPNYPVGEYHMRDPRTGKLYPQFRGKEPTP